MSMSKDRAFESLFLENYSSFILTIECKEEFTHHDQEALSGHNEGKITKKPQENKCLSSRVAKGWGGGGGHDPVSRTNFNKIHASRTVLRKFHESRNST